MTNSILFGQNRFSGGVLVGFNAAQLDGDASAGYNKVGAAAGIRGITLLTPKKRLLIDILYSQRGSRTTLNEALVGRNCTLNYLEVPVQLQYLDWEKTDKSGVSYYKVGISAGLSYGRLFGARSNDAFTHASVLDKFSKNDFSFTAGINYMVNRHWGFTWRWSSSFNYLFDPRDFPGDPNASSLLILRGYFLTFQTMWQF